MSNPVIVKADKDGGQVAESIATVENREDAVKMARSLAGTPSVKFDVNYQGTVVTGIVGRDSDYFVVDDSLIEDL